MIGKRNILTCVSRKPEDHLKYGKSVRDRTQSEVERLKYNNDRNILDYPSIFEYTAAQRNYECNRHMHTQFRKDVKIKAKTVSDLDVNAIESSIGEGYLSSHTLDLEKYYEFVKRKGGSYLKLFEFYKQELFRRLKFNAKLKLKNSEKAMLRRFKEMYGTPEECLIVFGDWSEYQGMKMGRPTPGVSMLRLFRSEGYNVKLINEAYTSQKCSCCCNVNAVTINHRKMIKWKDRNKLKEEQHLVDVHDVKKCTTCETPWNRDINAARNIHTKLINCIYERELEYLIKVPEEDMILNIQPHLSRVHVQEGES